MKSTLLDMTQNILSALSSDAVNSISDTTESMQVAQIIKNKYYDIIGRGELPEHKELISLDASLDSTTPVLMYIPDNVTKIEWLKYFDTNVGISSNTSQHGINTDLPTPAEYWFTTSTSSNAISIGTKTFTVEDDDLTINIGDPMVAVSGSNMLFGTVTDYQDFTLIVSIQNKIGLGTYTSWNIYYNEDAQSPPGYQYVTILPVEQFVDMVNQFDVTDTDTQSFTFTDTYNNVNNTFNFYYKTNKQPQYCTVLSNYYVIFDSYDVTQDTTLQASKSMALGLIAPTWDMTDNFTPDLDESKFQLLINEAKLLAFFELKQQQHPLADRETRRQWINLSKNKSVSGKPTYFNALPDFGRGGGGFITGKNKFR